MIDPDAEPHRHIGFLIRRAQQLHVAAWARLASAEVSSVQYSVLVVLEQEGAMSQRELCDEIDLDRSTIADLVARMESRGLVERRRDPADARRNLVMLTEHGRDERRRLRPLVDDVQDALVGALSDADEAALRAGLRAMLSVGAETPT